jgi:hypothetical protein
VAPAWARVRRIFGTACLAGSLLVLQSPDAAAQTPPLKAPALSISAGIGGLVKAGRWVPVQITLDPAGTDIDGDLIVSFGRATVHRRVELAGPASRRFEFYIRTAEAESTITAQLRAGASLIARAETDVRPLAQAERVMLCVDGGDRALADPACSITIPPEQLPRSPRGYEVVDAIVIAGAEPALAPEQRDALAVWRALQRLNETGDLGLIGQAARPTLPRGLPTPLLRIVAVMTMVYVGAILLAGIIRSMPGHPLRHGYVVLGIIALGGSATVVAVGAGVPGRPIVVHHQTVAEQMPGTSATLLTVRGIVEFPAFREFTLRWPADDAMLEPAAAGDPVNTSDTNGYPVLGGIHGLGTRQPFGGEAVLRTQLLGVESNDAAITISNRSSAELRDCRFAGGFTPEHVGRLATGATVTATQVSPSTGPAFTCTLDGVLVAFEENGANVVSAGTTVVAVYR